MVNIYTRSATGARHRNKHEAKQDHRLVARIGNYTLICAADGHGGAEYTRSGIGAQIACAAAKYACGLDLEDPRDFAAGIKDRYDELVALHLRHRPPAEWEKSVLHLDDPRVLYGTTILGAVVGEGRVRVFQIGDGSVVLCNKDRYIEIEKDPRCSGNITTSLVYTRHTALKHFYVRDFDADDLACVILATDGYAGDPLDLVYALTSSGADDRLDSVCEQYSNGDDQTVVCLYDPDVACGEEFSKLVGDKVRIKTLRADLVRTQKKYAENKQVLDLACRKILTLDDHTSAEYSDLQALIDRHLEVHNRFTADIASMKEDLAIYAKEFETDSNK